MRKIHLSKFPERPQVLKASLMFVDDNKICDGCDSHVVKCASIHTLDGGVSILCQDCIEGILESLDPSAVRNIKIDKIMIPTLETIIKASKIHPSRVFNVYIFGSQVYGTATSDSDWDIIMIANNSVESTEIRNGLFNIHVYTPDKFKADLEWHRINNLECIWAPDWAKLKETIKFDNFKINLAKLRHATSHISSNSWVKCKKKLELTDEYHTGVKSLFHSLRIPMFATQIATSGRITDFSCANFIWDKIKRKRWTWEELDEEFRELRNTILTDFRKVAEK